MREVKWSQWDATFGMVRCGRRDLKTLTNWMMEFGKGAMECLKNTPDDIQHAVYGIKYYDKDDHVEDVRFYSNTYFTDKELDDKIDELVAGGKSFYIYAVHKLGGFGNERR